jgi:hypothetical protein
MKLSTGEECFFKDSNLLFIFGSIIFFILFLLNFMVDNFTHLNKGFRGKIGKLVSVIINLTLCPYTRASNYTYWLPCLRVQSIRFEFVMNFHRVWKNISIIDTNILVFVYKRRKCNVSQTVHANVKGREFRTIITYESRGVVVTGCLGVTVSLKYRVSLHNLILKGTL